MSTSSKVTFKLDALRKMAIESLENRVALAQQHLESFSDDEALAHERDEWFENEKQRVIELAELLQSGDVDHYRLDRFKIRDMPDVDHYDRRRATSDLHSLTEQLSQVKAKSGALVADEEGNIALTKTQLREFFAL